MPAPETSYAKSGEVNVAYQVLGDGPLDLVYVWGWLSHLDFQWTEPTLASFLRRLASFSRLIMFDKRGTGLSDPVGSTPTFEERMDDIRAVMDAVGSERAALLGFSEGTALSVLFAATYPERTRALVLYDGVAVGALVEEGRVDPVWTESAMRVRDTIDHWGEGETMGWHAERRVVGVATSEDGSSPRDLARDEPECETADQSISWLWLNRLIEPGRDERGHVRIRDGEIVWVATPCRKSDS